MGVVMEDIDLTFSDLFLRRDPKERKSRGSAVGGGACCRVHQFHSYFPPRSTKPYMSWSRRSGTRYHSCLPRIRHWLVHRLVPASHCGCHICTQVASTTSRRNRMDCASRKGLICAFILYPGEQLLRVWCCSGVSFNSSPRSLQLLVYCFIAQASIQHPSTPPPQSHGLMEEAKPSNDRKPLAVHGFL